MTLRFTARTALACLVLAGSVPCAHAEVASWYGPGFHGRRAADGSRFDQNALTAAHKTLRFGTRVRVTCAATGRSVVVRITDRGPFVTLPNRAHGPRAAGPRPASVRPRETRPRPPRKMP